MHTYRRFSQLILFLVEVVVDAYGTLDTLHTVTDVRYRPHNINCLHMCAQYKFVAS